MNTQEFNELLNQVLDLGVDISMSKSKETGNVWYDMNTGMKSSLFISLQNEVCVFKGRYDVYGTIEDFDDLKYQVSQCQYGRDFGNPIWLDNI